MVHYLHKPAQMNQADQFIDAEAAKGELVNRIQVILKANRLIHQDKLTISVENGLVNIKGQAEWNFQQDFMIGAVKQPQGVADVRLFMYAFK